MTEETDRPDETGEGQTDSKDERKSIDRRPKGIQWEIELRRLNPDFTVADLAADLGCSIKSVYAARKSVQKKLNRVSDLLGMGQTARKTDGRSKRNQVAVSNDELNAQDLQTQDSCNTTAKPVSVSETDLAAIRSGDPAQVEAALARIAAGAMAEGILSIPEPRTVTELTKWLQAWRQVTGRDKANQAQPQTVGLIMPVRNLRRANGKTVDVSPDSPEAIQDTDPDGPED